MHLCRQLEFAGIDINSMLYSRPSVIKKAKTKNESKTNEDKKTPKICRWGARTTCRRGSCHLGCSNDAGCKIRSSDDRFNGKPRICKKICIAHARHLPFYTPPLPQYRVRNRFAMAQQNVRARGQSPQRNRIQTSQRWYGHRTWKHRLIYAWTIFSFYLQRLSCGGLRSIRQPLSAHARVHSIPSRNAQKMYVSVAYDSSEEEFAL